MRNSNKLEERRTTKVNFLFLKKRRNEKVLQREQGKKQHSKASENRKSTLAQKYWRRRLKTSKQKNRKERAKTERQLERQANGWTAERTIIERCIIRFATRKDAQEKNWTHRVKIVLLTLCSKVFFAVFFSLFNQTGKKLFEGL